MNTFALPLAAFILTAIGWISREIWRWRNAKRQAAHDASKILSDKKKLLEEMISKTEDTSSKQTLLTQLDEVNAALLGLHSQRLRHALKGAGLPTEEMLIVDGHSQVQPQETTYLKNIIAEVNALPPSLSTEVLRVLGDAYYYIEHYEDAKNTYDKILNLNPYDQVALRHRGAVYSHMKKDTEALNDYNRALELKPDDYVAFNDRGVSFAYLKRYEEALADFNHALEIRPDHPATLNNRGEVYSKLKRYPEAIADINRALELRPNYPAALYNRASIYSVCGETDGALTYLEKAIALGDECREEAKTNEDFDNIRADPRFKKLIESD